MDENPSSQGFLEPFLREKQHQRGGLKKEESDQGASKQFFLSLLLVFHLIFSTHEYVSILIYLLCFSLCKHELNSISREAIEPSM